MNMLRYALATVLLVLTAACTPAPTEGQRGDADGSIAPSASAAGSAETSPTQPNIVFVLTDDLSMNLLPFMPNVLDLQQRGMSFSNYFVNNSLCCPSRATLLTGGFPHTTQVLTNGGADGGWPEFVYRGDDRQTFATSLSQAGYHTAFLGKYLNGYQLNPPAPKEQMSVPPGWDEWYVPGGHDGYSGFSYTLNENGQAVSYGDAPGDYITDVLADKAVDVVQRTTAKDQPLLLEISTFAPHWPFTPAPRHAELYPDLTYPRTAAFNSPGLQNVPAWLAGRAALTPAQTAEIDTQFRQRARSVRAVDDLVATVSQALESAGVLDETYFVFSSDNGFHMGEHRLAPGKMTAFDTDIRVPLIVAGPGIAEGSTSEAMVASVDLCPTFIELGGGLSTALVDGRSMVPLLQGSDETWREAVLIEQYRPATPEQAGPDTQANSQLPPTYLALRTRDALYVEYEGGDRAYYNTATDPDQLRNIAPSLPAPQQQSLSAALKDMATCRGTAQCWTAANPKLATAG